MKYREKYGVYGKMYAAFSIFSTYDILYFIE